MATPSPDPTPRDWLRLSAEARHEPPPEIDVRAAVFAQLATEQRNEPAPSWTDALFELLRLPWMRAGLACGLAAALVLCTLGWRAMSAEMPDPLFVALQAEDRELLTAITP